ncbi:MAG: Inner membrane symporter YicJ [Chloroflexi bacterium ADurb.Bin120]|jgi:GPH family glycoside/pentoside/hexuronide:cation symporter|uniref:Major facilitator superfamily MFS_1 n=1 Tax=Candidatus Brevifilum fermentans TaxID=1986204 RepID=A0A1Y6K632_9CHLR|nr:MFS transporter [Brevefilum fermentans]MDI9565220.1 MFS transporter [Chloroflexota bacterium]OQB86803.1 MAG: Inner membrane symporter YicJ [Chloroflexi bacterium ADurb.Bin120]SMX55036.1 Major facilitator superfamily MFS_1 [Brevefilum fermentans]HOM66601.1 MFS transporter [Brevefilum fermentans]
MKPKNADHLSLRYKILYSSASIGLNILSITISTWLLYFYSPPVDSGRTIFLPIGVVGAIMTIISLYDALIDPFIGHWSDNLRSKMGRRRPFILFSLPFIAISMVLLWMPPGGSTWLVAGYLTLIMLVYSSSFSLAGIPYDATMAELAENNAERISLSSWKSVFGIIGVMAGSLLIAPLFESKGALYMGIVTAVVGFVTILLSVPAIRETRKPVGEQIDVIEGLKHTLKNKPFQSMLLSTLLVHIAYAMITANLPYFVTLVIGASEGDVGLYLGVVVILMVLTTPVWNWLGKKYSNAKVMRWSMVLLAVFASSNLLVGQVGLIPAPILAYATLGLIGPFLGGYLILAYSMMGNVVDYDEYLTNRRREAIFYGAFSLAVGIGPSIAAILLPFLLNTFGYTASNPLGVRLVFPVISLVVLLGLLAFCGYNLGDSIEETKHNLGLVEKEENNV